MTDAAQTQGLLNNSKQRSPECSLSLQFQAFLERVKPPLLSHIWKPAGTKPKQPGFFRRQSDIRQLSSADVALLKGELWEGNENAALAH